MSIEAMLFYCIFNGNYVSSNITYKPVIHCPDCLHFNIYYSTTSPLRVQGAVVSPKN